MAEQLFALTPRTADGVRRLLADGGSTGGRATTGAAARGVTWVQVTGEGNEDGWHPGLVHTSAGAEWTEGTLAVLVAAGDLAGAELVEGRRYLCTRTGDADDGTPRFRAALGGAVDHALTAGTLFATVNAVWNVAAAVTLPTAGVYLVWGGASGWSEVTVVEGAENGASGLRSRLYDATAGAVIPGTERHMTKTFLWAGGGLLTGFNFLEVNQEGSSLALCVVETDGPKDIELQIHAGYGSPADEPHDAECHVAYCRIAGGGGGGTVGGLTGTFGG